MAIKVEDLNVVPERDLFRRGEAVTETRFVIDPEGERCWVSQWREDYANAEYWNGLLIYSAVHGENESETPNEAELRAYLEGTEAQELMARVCAGWERSGENGYQDSDSHAAFDDLCAAIARLPSTEWAVWDVENWLCETSVSATTTDTELKALADECQGDAEAENVVLEGDILEYLTGKRDEKRAEWLERAVAWWDVEPNTATVVREEAEALMVLVTWADGDTAEMRVAGDSETVLRASFEYQA